MTRRLGSLVELAALGCGVLVALMWLAGWRIAGGTERPGTAVSVWVDPSSTLALDPFGKLFARSDLAPARTGARETFTARNATAAALRVRVHATADSKALDDILTVQVLAGERTLFAGPLQLLRTRGSTPFVLRSHATQSLSFRTWISAGAGDRYVARAGEVHLRFDTEPVTA